MEGVRNSNILMLETGPFSVSQGPMEPRKTSRSWCRKYCFRSFQNRCRYIRKAAKAATLQLQYIIQTCLSLVTIEFRCRLSMFEYWRKSLATLCGSHSNLAKIYLSQVLEIMPCTARAQDRAMTNCRTNWQCSKQLKLDTILDAWQKHSISPSQPDSLKFWKNAMANFCSNDFAVWVCEKPLHHWTIQWSHPLHRAEIEFLWKIGVSTCSIGKDILIFSSVTLLLQCPCWKPTIYHRFVDISSRYALFWWLVCRLYLKKSRSACSVLGQNIDISFGPNGAPLCARWCSTLRAALRSY